MLGIANYFRKTEHFHPGLLRFKQIPVRLSLLSQEGTVSISEQEAVYLLCMIAADIDDEVLEVEMLAVVNIVLLWPFFSNHRSEEAFNALLERVFNLKDQHEIVDLVEAAFSIISRSNQSLAYAAILEVVYADQKMRDREVEFIALARTRFNISKSTDEALTFSAKTRFGL